METPITDMSHLRSIHNAVYFCGCVDYVLLFQVIMLMFFSWIHFHYILQYFRWDSHFAEKYDNDPAISSKLIRNLPSVAYSCVVLVANWFYRILAEKLTDQGIIIIIILYNHVIIIIINCWWLLEMLSYYILGRGL